MAPVQNPGATQVQIDLHPFPGVAQVQFFWVQRIQFPANFAPNCPKATKPPRPTDKLFLFHKNQRKTQT